MQLYQKFFRYNIVLPILVITSKMNLKNWLPLLFEIVGKQNLAFNFIGEYVCLKFHEV